MKIRTRSQKSNQVFIMPKCYINANSFPIGPFVHVIKCHTYRASYAFFQCKIAIIYLSISLNMCFGYSKEPSHQDNSFEYPQHMFWLRNTKKNVQLRTLIWGLMLIPTPMPTLTPMGSASK